MVQLPQLNLDAIEWNFVRDREERHGTRSTTSWVILVHLLEELGWNLTRVCKVVLILTLVPSI